MYFQILAKNKKKQGEKMEEYPIVSAKTWKEIDRVAIIDPNDFLTKINRN